AQVYVTGRTMSNQHALAEKAFQRERILARDSAVRDARRADVTTFLDTMNEHVRSYKLARMAIEEQNDARADEIYTQSDLTSSTSLAYRAVRHDAFRSAVIACGSAHGKVRNTLGRYLERRGATGAPF